MQRRSKVVKITKRESKEKYDDKIEEAKKWAAFYAKEKKRKRWIKNEVRGNVEGKAIKGDEVSGLVNCQ